MNKLQFIPLFLLCCSECNGNITTLPSNDVEATKINPKPTKGIRIPGMVGVFPKDVIKLAAKIKNLQYFYVNQKSNRPGNLKNTFILYGHPGNGKHTLVYNLSEDSAVKYVEVSLALLNDIQQATSYFKSIKELSGNGPIVVLLEDLESILSLPTNVQSVIQQEIKYLEISPHVIIVGIINSELQLTIPDYFRSYETIKIHNQDAIGRAEILQFYWKKHAYLNKSTIELLNHIAEKTNGLCSQALEELVEISLVKTHLNGYETPTLDDLLEAISIVKKSNHGNKLTRLRNGFNKMVYKIDKAQKDIKDVKQDIENGINTVKEVANAIEDIMNNFNY